MLHSVERKLDFATLAPAPAKLVTLDNALLTGMHLNGRRTRIVFRHEVIWRR